MSCILLVYVLSISLVISPWPLPDWEWLAYSLHSHKGCTQRMNKGKSPPGIVNISIWRDVPHFVKRNFKSNNNKYCFNFQTVCIVSFSIFRVNYWYNYWVYKNFVVPLCLSSNANLVVWPKLKINAWVFYLGTNIQFLCSSKHCVTRKVPCHCAIPHPAFLPQFMW